MNNHHIISTLFLIIVTCFTISCENNSTELFSPEQTFSNSTLSRAAFPYYEDDPFFVTEKMAELFITSNKEYPAIQTIEPYELDGTGPYLVHICCSFARKGSKEKKASGALIKLNTCFAVRGKFNGIHP